MKSDDRVRYSILMDIYGKLLTEKQMKIFSEYADEDYSIVEIADMEEMSRQAVSDTIKTVTSRLDDLEEKLGIARRNDEISLIVEEIMGDVEDDRLKEKLSSIRKITMED